MEILASGLAGIISLGVLGWRLGGVLERIITERWPEVNEIT